MDDAVKKAFMGTMNEQFVQEFGFDLKTMMLFADAISRVKTSREKQLEAELEQVKKERDKAISDFHKAAKENGICSSCKHRFNECVGICMCDADGEDHWEWEGLNG